MRLKKLTFVFSLLIQSFVYAQNITTRQFSTKEGLPDLYIYSSFQDKNGYLWSATTKGLVKFDGQVFSKYALADSDDFIYSGVADSKGINWFGSFSGKIFYCEKNKEKLMPFKDSINGSIDRIISSSDNVSLYFVSKGNGIYLLRNNTLSQIEHLQAYQINSVIEFQAGILILATPEGLLKVNVNTAEVSKINGTDFNITQIQKIKGSKNRLLLATSDKGLIDVQLDEELTESILNSPLNYKFLSEQGISCFYLDEASNSLFVAGRNEVFYVINISTKNIKIFSPAEYKATANSIIVDRDNNIWISTAGKGLFRFYKEEYSFYNIDNNSVYAIARDNSGFTYFATDRGIYVTDAYYNVVKTIEKVGTHALKKINALYYDGLMLWVGTENDGLLLFNPKTMEPSTIQFSEIANISINAISGDLKTKTIYVSTNLDGAFIYGNYILQNHFSVHNSLLHNNVYYCFGSKSSKVYYATHNTAFNFSKGNQVYEIDIKSNGLISDFNSFAESAEGHIAVGTNGDGVYFLNDTSISPLELNEKLESKFCNTLTYDNSDNLWIALRYGLYKYYSREKVLKKIELVNDDNRMFNMNSFFLDKSGELLFGTTKDIISFKSSNSNSELPKSYIVNVKMFDSLISKNDKQIFKNGKYTIAFEYSALCLKNSEEVYFKYMLEGRDNKWCEPTKSRVVEFSNLTEGEYTFKVIAYNGDGFSAKEITTFTFIIDKPIWKNAWFWLIVLVLLILLVLFIVRVRTASLIKAKMRLEKTVEEKTSELRHEKELVEAKNSIIEAQNKDITSSITYAKRIQEAILPDKNLDENIKNKILVYYKPKDIVSGDFYWFAEKNNRFLLAAFDCTGHGVPGAFMSMIGTTLLNKIVFDNNENDPSKILLEMDKEISKSLRQENSEVNDGMEAGLCSIDLNAKEVLYSGAKRALFHFKKTIAGYSLEEYKADKFPIGGFADVKNKQFTTHQITGTSGDMIYMFSDGIIDQFNDQRKRISTKGLRELLSTIVHLDVNEQWDYIDAFLLDWKGATKQTDDILLLGIRL